MRIERAVLASDLFIFLVSPEAVVKGKYTLTELSYARKKWPSASGRVLPVIVAPTPINSIPPFLRSVSIFEPEGNIAADTAAEADKILQRSSRRSVWSFALLGAVTGVLSYVALLYNVLDVPFVEQPFNAFNVTLGFSVIPGPVFGVLIAYLNWKFGKRSKFQLAIILCATVLSWIMAVNAWEIANDQLQKYTYRVPHVEIPSNGPDGSRADPRSTGEQSNEVQRFPFTLAVCGMIGGLVGGIGTLLGVALANDRARRARGFLPIVVVAVLIGALFGIPTPTTEGAWEWYPPWLIGLFLFSCWQAAFAGMLAQVLARTDFERP